MSAPTPSCPARSGSPADPKPGPSLAWVDEWIRRVRPYIFVRAADQLLIKRPNQAHKLNSTGVRLLQALLGGTSIESILRPLRDDPARSRQIAQFLHEVRRSVEGSLTETNVSAAVEIRPLERNFSRLPVLSEIAVTYRCNLHCRFCYAGCNHPTPPLSRGRTLNCEDVITVLDKIRHQAQVPSVSFTGGEPTLRPELCAWIAAAKARDFRVNLISNGTRIDAEFARRLASAGLDSAQISLEAPDAVLHDAITGVEGSFARSTAAVAHLAQAGIHVHTNTTLCRDNLAAAPQMPTFVRNTLGRDRLSMNLVIPTGTAAQSPSIAVTYSEVGPLIDQIHARSRAAGVEFLWYSPTPLCLYNPIPRGLGNKGCAACDGLLSVAPDGSVLPCSAFPEPVGNLLHEDFQHIWDAARSRQIRHKSLAPTRCQSCEHLAVCHGACPLYWKALGCAELQSYPAGPTVLPPAHSPT